VAVTLTRRRVRCVGPVEILTRGEAVRGAVAVLGMVGVFVLFFYGVALPQPFPNCTEYGFNIPQTCCCTAGCCREADSGEVVHERGDWYRIVPSGQIVQRTGWSPDGRTIRCACDNKEGKWVSSPQSKTHCLFMPMPSS
jgi:hypothetical protein